MEFHQNLMNKPRSLRALKNISSICLSRDMLRVTVFFKTQITYRDSSKFIWDIIDAVSEINRHAETEENHDGKFGNIYIHDNTYMRD